MRFGMGVSGQARVLFENSGIFLCALSAADGNNNGVGFVHTLDGAKHRAIILASPSIEHYIIALTHQISGTKLFRNPRAELWCL